jgi:Flp pilus assembly protein TadG
MYMPCRFLAPLKLANLITTDCTSSANRRFPPKRQRGVSLLEFAIVAPLLFFVVIGLIFYSLYFTARGGAYTAAQRALSFASVVPNLDSTDNTAATAARTSVNTLVTDLAQKLASGPVTVTNAELILPNDPGYPNPVAGLTSRQEALASFPMVVRVRGEIRPIFFNNAILGAVFPASATQFEVRAIGYREPRFRSSLPAALDCEGNPIGAGIGANCGCQNTVGWPPPPANCAGFANPPLTPRGACFCDCPPEYTTVGRVNGVAQCECPIPDISACPCDAEGIATFNAGQCRCGIQACPNPAQTRSGCGPCGCPPDKSEAALNCPSKNRKYDVIGCDCDCELTADSCSGNYKPNTTNGACECTCPKTCPPAFGDPRTKLVDNKDTSTCSCECPFGEAACKALGPNRAWNNVKCCYCEYPVPKPEGAVENPLTCNWKCDSLKKEIVDNKCLCKKRDEPCDNHKKERKADCDCKCKQEHKDACTLMKGEFKEGDCSCKCPEGKKKVDGICVCKDPCPGLPGSKSQDPSTCACTCKNGLKATSCNANQTWDFPNCECDCNLDADKCKPLNFVAPCSCGTCIDSSPCPKAGHVRDSLLCTCDCPKDPSCKPPFSIDTDGGCGCKCMATPAEKLSCPAGKYFAEPFCACICYACPELQRRVNPDDPNNCACELIPIG